MFEDFHLTLACVNVFPRTSYTHVINCYLIRSWIDHCLWTETACPAVTDIFIDYNYLGSDNSLMMVTIKLGLMPITTLHENTYCKIKWDFNNADKSEHFFQLVCGNLVLADNAMYNCFDTYYVRNDHKNNLETNWAMFSQLVYDVGKQVFGETHNQPNTLSGWNSHVK